MSIHPILKNNRKAHGLDAGKFIDITMPSRLGCDDGAVQIFIATDKDYGNDNRKLGSFGVFLRFSSSGQTDDLPAHSRVLALDDATIWVEPIEDDGRLSEQAERMFVARTMDVEGRFRFEIDRILDIYQHNNCREGVEVKIYRQTMGDMLGCSREMAGRIAGKLEDQGIIRWSGKTLTIYRDAVLKNG